MQINAWPIPLSVINLPPPGLAFIDGLHLFLAIYIVLTVAIIYMIPIWFQIYKSQFWHEVIEVAFFVIKYTFLSSLFCQIRGNYDSA